MAVGSSGMYLVPCCNGVKCRARGTSYIGIIPPFLTANGRGISKKKEPGFPASIPFKLSRKYGVSDLMCSSLFLRGRFRSAIAATLPCNWGRLKIHAMFFQRLTGHGGARRVFSDGSDQIVKFNRWLLAEASLQANVDGGCCHRRCR
jgi:hypothetical protein